MTGTNNPQPGFTIPTSTTFPMNNMPDEKKQDGSALPWILAILAVVAVGGGVYAYSLHKKNERRRQAVRAQQVRQTARARVNQPRTRMAPNAMNQETRAFNNQAAPFMPTGNGAPTTTFTPVSQQTSGFNPASLENAFRPQDPLSNFTEAEPPTDFSAPGQDMAQTNTFDPQNFQPNGFNVPNGQPPRRRRSDKYHS